MTIETYRSHIIQHLKDNQNFQNIWQVYKPKILERTRNLTQADAILALGSQLSELFTLLRVPNNRNNSVLSQAGNAWENLVIIYLNMVFSGTNGIAIKPTKALCPQTFRDATSIWYGNTQTNTEADVCIVIFPDNFTFPENDLDFIKNLDHSVRPQIPNIQFGIIQCKTNWNDNAQIPMLWDMVYRANYTQGQGVRIGTNGYNIRNFLGGGISYSFMTVPTQNKPIRPNTMPVNRVSALSGGNFWGHPSTPHVAQSISEIFNRNFRNAFDPHSVVTSIERAINANKLQWVHDL